MSSGYFCLLCHTGVQYSGKIRLIEPQGVNGHRRPVPGVSSAGCPPAAVRHGRARQSSGMDRVGIAEGSCGYQAHGFSIRGKFVLSKNPGYKATRVAMWLNVVLTPG